MRSITLWELRLVAISSNDIAGEHFGVKYLWLNSFKYILDVMEIEKGEGEEGGKEEMWEGKGE